MLAAGVGSDKLLADLRAYAAFPRLVSGKGVSIELELDEPGPPHVVRTPNRDFACGTHAVPRSARRIYIGATNRVSGFPGANTGATAGELHNLLHSAIHELNTNWRTANVETIRVGHRPLATTGQPVYGATPIQGLYIATGTYRNGILLAPAIADHIVSSILCEGDGSLPRGVTTATGEPTRGELLSIAQEGVDHLVSFLLEPGGRMPYNRQRELRAFLREIVTLLMAEGDVADSELLSRLKAFPLAEVIPDWFYDTTRPNAS